MNDKVTLGALYGVAQQQQATAERTIEELKAQAEAFGDVVQTLATATAAIQTQPALIDKAVRQATNTAITEALNASSTRLVANSTAVVQNAAQEFLSVTLDASKVARDAANNSQRAIRMVSWYFHLAVFSLGLAFGAGGLYLSYTPKIPAVTLDAAEVVVLLMQNGICKKR